MKELLRVVKRNDDTFIVTNRRVYKLIPRKEIDNYKNVFIFLFLGPAIEF